MFLRSAYFRAKSTDDVLVCRTRAVTRQLETDMVTVRFDTQAQRSMNNVFRFRPNPTVTQILPLKSFHSGGRVVTVKGTAFDIVQTPRMYYMDKDKMYRSNMTVSVRLPHLWQKESHRVFSFNILFASSVPLKL